VASQYISSNIAVIPVPASEKNPGYDGWQNLRLTIEDVPRYWTNGQNIGALNGEPSGWRVCVDLDVPGALGIAGRFLLPTLTSGRKSRRHSHWWYVAPGARNGKFKDLDGSVLLELRSTGCQTIVAVPLVGCIGNFPVKIDGATVSGDDFSKGADTCPGAELAQGSTCSIEVAFNPNNLGPHSGSLTLDPGSVTLINLPIIGSVTVDTVLTDGTTVSLSGTGINPPDADPPSVTSFSPTGKKAKRGANVTATFDEDMLASTINTTTFTLTKKGKKGAPSPVPAVVTYDPTTKTATLDPDEKLKKATYEAKVTTGARDLANNALDQDPSTAGSQEQIWTFRIKR
jgi:hypothetical protein